MAGSPFISPTRTIAAVNGEIYNHRAIRRQLRPDQLCTLSDCEVVLPLFEAAPDGAFLERLDGIFALVAWDSRRRRGLLARDRFGVKPLYYVQLPHGLLFASELKSLLAHPTCPRTPELTDVNLCYIGSEDYVPVSRDREVTYVRGISMLGGGEMLTFSPSTSQRRTWWSLAPAVERSRDSQPVPLARCAETYADLLEESVASELAADCPMAAFLSGGLDSALIVAIAAEKGEPLDCFTVSHATTVAVGDVGRAASLARLLGLRFFPADFVAEAIVADFSLSRLEEVVWALDAPKFAPELFLKFHLHRFLRSTTPNTKVVMVGQGADEFAGGYSRSFSTPRASWEEYVESSLAPRDARGVAPFHREMLDRLNVLRTHNLWHEDRVGSAWGTETRVPFLNHRLVEFLVAQPEAMHAKLFWDKRIERTAARRWLGPEFTEAPKVLFWQAEDRSSIHILMARCARRAYAEFRDAYPDARAALDVLDRTATGLNAAGRTATQRLLNAMTTRLFARLCARGGDQAPPTIERTPLSVDAKWLTHG